MRSQGRVGAITAGLSVVVGFLLTLGAFFWSVVVVENIYYALRIPNVDWVVDVPRGCVLIVTGFWIVLLLKRAFRVGFDPSELSRGAQALAILQSFMLAAAAWLIWQEHPATSTKGCWDFESAPCLVEKQDWATTVGWATIVLTAAILAVLAAISIADTKTNWTGGGSFPHLGTGVTLLVAAVVLHLAASGVVLLVDLVARYLNQMNPWRWGGERSIPLLRQYDYGEFIYRGSDTLAASWAPIVLLLLTALAVRLLLRRLAGSSNEPGARKIHRLITRPGTVTYPLCVLVAVIAIAVAITWTLTRMASVQTAGLTEKGSEGLNEFIWFLTVVGLHALILALPFALLSGNVRSTIAVLSDVVGYWSVVHHPLAAPPYRFDLIDTAASHIASLPKPIVIVGHSQGSVLAVDIVERLSQRDDYNKANYALVTCGSPLGSLYSTYFPHYFPSTRRHDTQTRVTKWRNLWRGTDPISTELGLDGDGDIEARDGSNRDVGDDLRKHGDYWIEDVQIDAVASIFDPT